MFGIKEALELLSNVTALGASPAVQQALSAFVAKQLGIPQNVLDAALRASKEAPDPKE